MGWLCLALPAYVPGGTAYRMASNDNSNFYSQESFWWVVLADASNLCIRLDCLKGTLLATTFNSLILKRVSLVECLYGCFQLMCPERLFEGRFGDNSDVLYSGERFILWNVLICTPICLITGRFGDNSNVLFSGEHLFLWTVLICTPICLITGRFGDNLSDHQGVCTPICYITWEVCTPICLIPGRFVPQFVWSPGSSRVKPIRPSPSERFFWWQV